MDTIIIQGPWKAAATPLPRKSFGLRKRIDEVIEGAIRQVPVCHTLQAELSAEIGVLAKLADFVAEKAQSLPSARNVRAAATLRDLQGILETMSAEVAP